MILVLHTLCFTRMMCKEILNSYEVLTGWKTNNNNKLSEFR